jgi:hypothetical protein
MLTSLAPVNDRARSWIVRLGCAETKGAPDEEKSDVSIRVVEVHGRSGNETSDFDPSRVRSDAAEAARHAAAERNAAPGDVSRKGRANRLIKAPARPRDEGAYISLAQHRNSCRGRNNAADGGYIGASKIGVLPNYRSLSGVP